MKQTLLATALAALVLLPGAALAQQVVRIAYVTAENSPQASQAPAGGVTLGPTYT